jgi:hypothetical protein
VPADPGVKTPGYYQLFLWNMFLFGSHCQKPAILSLSN